MPIKKKNINSIVKDLIKAQKEADIIEIWFDEFEHGEAPCLPAGRKRSHIYQTNATEGSNHIAGQNLEKIFSLKKKPIIYKSLGNIRNIENVLLHKVEYIDLDISASKSLIRKVREISPKTKIIISHHDFRKTPSDKELKKIADRILEKGADIIKIATQAKIFTDSLRMLHLLEQLTQKGGKAICLCMGEEGIITRATGHLFGNYLMYAPLKDNDKTAPGQITIKELKKIQCLLK